MNNNIDNDISNNKSQSNHKLGKLICLGEISSVFGINGCVKILSYTQNCKDLINYPRIYDYNGVKCYNLVFHFVKKKHLICSVEGVTSRNKALELVGQKLYAPMADFRTPADEEFYIEELVGCKVIAPDKDHNSEIREIGEIIAMHNFGAEDIVEIQFEDGEREMLPFKKAIFPDINLNQKQVTYIAPQTIVSASNENK
jgi:16S rRNA processing protein RimM